MPIPEASVTTVKDSAGSGSFRHGTWINADLILLRANWQQCDHAVTAPSWIRAAKGALIAARLFWSIRV